MRVLVTYASAQGSAADVAVAVAERLEHHGLEVDVRPCAHARDAWRYDAVVVGSAKHGHHWERAALDYLRAQAPDLAERPTWLFQTGCCADEADHHKDLPRAVRHLLLEIGLDDPVDLDERPEVRHLGGSAAAGRPQLAGLGASDLRRAQEWADGIAAAVRGASEDHDRTIDVRPVLVDAGAA